jgi:hypothetical protein
MDITYLENWETIIKVAFTTLGMVQHVKSFFPNAKSWVWALVAPIVCGCVAYSTCWPWVFLSLNAFALAQLGYENMLQIIDRIVGIKLPDNKDNGNGPGQGAK